MCISLRFSCVGFCFLVSVLSSHGQLAQKGRLLLAEDFRSLAAYTKEAQPVAEGWRAKVWHGTWKRTAEGLESVWEKGHNPVIVFEGGIVDAVIEVDFRYRKEAGKNAYLRIGPMARELDPRAYTVSAWVNADSKARPPGVVLEHEEWRTQGYTGMATRIARFEPDTWYTVRLEIVGDEALVTCNGVTASGRYEKFALPKPMIALGVGHCSHELRRLRIYEAKAAPDWKAPSSREQPTYAIEAIAGRDSLSPATLEKIQRMTPLFDGRTLSGWIQAQKAPLTPARGPDTGWVARDGVLASTGAGRGVLYTEKDYENYRLIFQVRQTSGNHFPGVLLFCQRPEPGALGLDALGGIQFAVPSGGHWDYRPGINKSGTHFRRPLRVRYDLKEWAQVEILVNARKGLARMAVAQPVGTRPVEILRFQDPAAGRAGPIALQMHNAGLFDEYRDLRIEVDPKEDKLITLD